MNKILNILKTVFASFMSFGVTSASQVKVNNSEAVTIQQSARQKKSIIVSNVLPSPIISNRTEFGTSGERNAYKFYHTPKKNQRQKRKYLRQNPCMR